MRPVAQVLNALDLSQWELYMLTKQQLVGTKTISLVKVRELSNEIMASEFRIKGRDKLQ
jgi:hypothetical protein